jgi:hypothetical protein
MVCSGGMPTRSIILKLVVPRRPDRLDAACALWSTHQAINEAVAYTGGAYFGCAVWAIEQPTARYRR